MPGSHALRIGFGRSRRRAVRERLFVKQAGRCALCGFPMRLKIAHGGLLAPMATLDHKVRVRDGGTHADANLRVVHKACNQRRD